ncbi:peptidoglycan DD-metalloendopeptidase family protein [Fertoebacter nigrum]|uniref:Peptidoglycan DD-metalloendopeptidase family protein n=1 Tax=Fertoeibacter niger TaxID=2656921 RepID=A0A8X8GRN9_9RHOB|nr:peptidoglycan DD-metalloendopeptidase family protein [Fertoeibacter niger]
MLTRLTYRIHTALEGILPEKRLYLKSDSETRFIRLRPATQLAALMGTTMFVGWTLVASSIILMDQIAAGSTRDQTERQQALYESRLNALSADRDLRAEEALRAQERFNLALDQVSDMQGELLASEDRRKELETGIDVIQDTLRRTIKERDAARDEAERMTLALAAETGSVRTGDERSRDAIATLEVLTSALGATAQQRDDMASAALLAKEQTETAQLEIEAMEARNDAIFTKLEEAVTVSMAPLDRMFRQAGLSPDALIDQVRSGYSGQGGPLSPLTLSTKGAAISPDEARANAVLQSLDRTNSYRLAAMKLPFAMPVKSAFRFTSGFGYRRDPKGAGTRMHSGTDFAASHGTPIYTTGDGVVISAGWDSGYGQAVRIRHDFGVETLYAHMSRIRVDVGQRVSRGDQIGDMGSTGRSTGTHLHYEVHQGGKPTNPMTFIKAANDVF